MAVSGITGIMQPFQCTANKLAGLMSRSCCGQQTSLPTAWVLQVSVHARIEAPTAFASECFECQTKPVPKTFPVCTIRNTPDKPIHCIVWAKELLFQRLFGRWVLVLAAMRTHVCDCWQPLVESCRKSWCPLQLGASMRMQVQVQSQAVESCHR